MIICLNVCDVGLKRLFACLHSRYQAGLVIDVSDCRIYVAQQKQLSIPEFHTVRSSVQIQSRYRPDWHQRPSAEVENIAEVAEVSEVAEVHVGAADDCDCQHKMQSTFSG